MEHAKTPDLFFAFVLTIVPFLTLAQINTEKDTWEYEPKFYCLSPRSNFTSDSTFAANLNRLISSISSLPPNVYGFYNVSVGETSENRVYAIGLCRREVGSRDCLNCIARAAKNLTEHCPEMKEALVWYTHCMFRYSNRLIFGRMETSPVSTLPNPNDTAANKDEFVRMQSELLNRLRRDAAAGGPRRKYAQGNSSAPPPYLRFFAIAQCTPDLSERDCNDCLAYGFGNITTCCEARVGIRWFCPSCNFRIESDWRFYELEYDVEADTQTPPTDATKGQSNNDPSKVVIIIVVPVAVLTILIACVCFFLNMKKRKAKQKIKGKDDEGELADKELLQLDFGTIKEATNNFSPDNQLGEGGFGAVYKGVLHDGQEIAVKRLSRNSGQGDNEFKNEVLLVAKLQHRNLVRLLGFCLEGQERLLVYEFIKNTSLDHFIFDPDKRPFLDWETRYKMIGGVARGLLYLHEDSRFRIIHRDLKANNILLDEAMNPKIADFGMAKLFEADQTTQRFTSRIAGTYGYMAPEYAMNGQFSVKTDVFSFGVLVLEIISGKRNNWSRDGENVEYLLSYTWRSWGEGRVFDVVDPSLTSGPRDEILRCIHIGLLCVQENAASRPTMASVVLMLHSYSVTLPTPSEPAFTLQNRVESDVSSSRHYNSGATESNASRTEISPFSLNDASVTELEPR